MPKVVLNNWYVAGFDDGHFIKSSPIVGPVSIRDGMIIETANTLYMLEGVCPKYKAWCDANSYTVKG